MHKRRKQYSDFASKWDEKRFWTFLRSGLRKLWDRWPPKYETLARVRRLKRDDEDGKGRYRYSCELCYADGLMKRQVDVNHIYGVGKLSSYQDIPQFVRNLLCPTSELEVACKSCHAEITYYERFGHDPLNWTLAQFRKLSMPEQRKLLASHDIPATAMSNQARREIAFKMLYSNGKVDALMFGSTLPKRIQQQMQKRIDT